MSLDELVQKVDALLLQVGGYVGSFEECGQMADFVGGDGALGKLPFAEAVTTLEFELSVLRYGLLSVRNDPSEGKLRALRLSTVPLFRRSNPAYKSMVAGLKLDDRLEQTYRYGDAILEYQKSAYWLLMAYTEGDSLLADTLVKDSFLFSVLDKVLMHSPLFEKESLDRASEAIVESMQGFLRALQRMYNFDVEEAMRDYCSIMQEVQTLCDEQGLPDPYHGYAARHIPSLNGDAQSHYKVSKHPLDADRVVQRRKQVLADKKYTELILRLAAADDWGSHVLEISEYLRWAKAEDIDKYAVVELVQKRMGGYEIVGAQHLQANIEDIVGQEKNVRPLGHLIYAFAEGRKIPSILLKGGPGVGKSLSIRAMAGMHQDLRVVLATSFDLNYLDKILQLLGTQPYRCILYIDDMNFEPVNPEALKTGLSGIKATPDNVALVASINPERYKDQDIPPSIQSRFGVVLNYGETLPQETWRAIMVNSCRRHGLGYSEELYTGFITAHSGEKDANATPVSGRTIEDYVTMQAALDGITMPEKLR